MAMSDLKLYSINSCGYCTMVRETLDKLGLTYQTIDVPWPHNQRTEVYKVSGQYMVPVLVDGDKILDDEYEIIDYLKQKYQN